MSKSYVRLLVAFAVLCSIAAPAQASTLQDVVFVANAEAGTVAVVDAQSFDVLKTIDVIPDGESPPLTDDPFHGATNPVVVGAVGVNLAQDLDVSPDGRTLYVSRGHRADVAAFDVASGDMLWRTAVAGLRADHMTISDDGDRLFVSDLTEDTVLALDTATGDGVGSFATGQWPHDNLMSPDGERVYNGSLGNILTPEETRNDRPDAVDAVLGHPFILTVVDASTLEVERSLEFPRGIRPFVLTSDETRLYAQLSEFHGIVEYDLEAGRMLRTTQLPIADGVTSDDYDFEAPHHGLALSADEELLCVAGRASDYVALVSRQTMQPVKIIPVDDAPGWAASSPDGSHCFVPSTRANTLTVISYETQQVVATIPMDAGPKYATGAEVPEDVLGG